VNSNVSLVEDKYQGRIAANEPNAAVLEEQYAAANGATEDTR
jgi:hypothetical protein